MTTSSTSPSALQSEFTEQVADWPQLALAPRSSGAVGFTVRGTVVGVLRRDGRLDVAVPGPVRAVLVEEEMAIPTVDDRGVEGIATVLEREEDISPAVLLLRLAYLYRRLLHSETPAVLRRIRIEIAAYDLPEALQDVYGTMLAKRPDEEPPFGRPSESSPEDERLAGPQSGVTPAHN